MMKNPNMEFRMKRRIIFLVGGAVAEIVAGFSGQLVYAKDELVLHKQFFFFFFGFVPKWIFIQF